MRNQRHDSTGRRWRGRIGQRLIGGFLPIAFVMAVAAAVPVAAASGGAAPFVQSHFELARGALEADGSIGVVVSAVDYVDAVEGSGTNTAVDVIFPGGECVATGPLDFEPRGMAGARVSGELPAECFDENQDISFSADVVVDVTWTGVGRVQHIRLPSDPSDPCRSDLVEREATAVGFVTISAPDVSLEIYATPAGEGFHHLIRQRDICRAPSPT